MSRLLHRTRGAGVRGRARRRLRYLRQLRELQLRDLGGLVLDLYRFGERRDDLVRTKLDAIIAADKERHALQALLDDRRRTYEVRQPGIGGTCPTCGDFHATDARFCARCGTSLTTHKAAEEATGEQPSPAEEALAGAVTWPSEATAPIPLRVVEDAEAVELAAGPEERRRAQS